MFHGDVALEFFGCLIVFWCLLKLLNLEVPVSRLFLIQRLQFVFLKTVFDNLFLFCYDCRFTCLSFDLIYPLFVCEV